MIPIETAFVGLVILFGMIGLLRGWAKELLVSFSVILARFVEFVLLEYVPVVNLALQALPPDTWLYVRLLIFIFIIAFGYATTVISAALGSRARKDKFEDTLLGFFIGLINGYLVVGSVWGFLADKGYEIWGITAPTTDAAMAIIDYLPTAWLGGPLLFVAVAVSFVFVLVVFV